MLRSIVDAGSFDKLDDEDNLFAFGVQTSKGGVIAAIVLQLYPSSMHVMWLATTKKRIGLGTFLYKMALELLQQSFEGRCKVITAGDLKNEEALSFWKGKGFEQLKQEFWWGDAEMRRVAKEHNYYSPDPEVENLLAPMVLW